MDGDCCLPGLFYAGRVFVCRRRVHPGEECGEYYDEDGNFHRDFMKVVKEGWLAPTHGEKDRFYPTTKGRKAIENRFDR